jgi:DNA-directed RNA polymerase subunit E'/Rpb7
MEYIYDKIIVEDNEIGADIYEIVRTKLINKFLGSCTQQHGHILEIDKIDIVDNVISPSNGKVNLLVRCLVKNLKPKKGHVYKGKIVRVYKNGIFIDVKGLINVGVSINNIGENAMFDQEKDAIINGDQIIKLNDRVRVEIAKVSYFHDNGFHCTGKLV